MDETIEILAEKAFKDDWFNKEYDLNITKTNLIELLRHQLSDLSRKINAVVQPVYVSRKIKGNLKPKEHKPPIVNQQNVVYYYKCGLCDTDYVGFTSRHLHQRVEEHTM